VSGDSQETFGDFKDSFSYGSRSDLSFKFLKGLSHQEASEFLSVLLEEVGSLFDDGSTDALVDLVYEWQVRAYRPTTAAKRPYVYEDRPFHELTKSLGEMSVGLVTSSGHYMSDDRPAANAGLTQGEAFARIGEFLRRAPELSEIPVDAPIEDVEVLHPGYDIRSVVKDRGVALPIDLLDEARATGRIRRLVSPVYSFVGACSQGRLRNELDEWVARWKAAGIDALFLVPV